MGSAYGPATLSSDYQIKIASEGLRLNGVETKKLGFFKRWLIKIAHNALEKSQQEQQAMAINKTLSGVGSINLNSVMQSESPRLDSDKAIRFNVYVATGGRIVEVNRYDRQKDRHVSGLYVITSEQDFGREIDKIITMEYLK